MGLLRTVAYYYDCCVLPTAAYLLRTRRAKRELSSTGGWLRLVRLAQSNSEFIAFRAEGFC
jgi:hypothetical protein